MPDTWNERFSGNEYYYGTEPNVFFAREIRSIPPGSLLTLGEGEGRNAVFAATLGWKVDAVDQSEAGRTKALALAQQHGVSLNYTIADISLFAFPKHRYDAVALIFLHLPEELRTRIHAWAAEALKPGGRIILEAYSRDQIRYTSGGPKDPALLYETSFIAADFRHLRHEKLEKVVETLDEGPHHRGRASVIRFVGIAR